MSFRFRPVRFSYFNSFMMRRLLEHIGIWCAVLLPICGAAAGAPDDGGWSYRGFSGGMALHTGWVGGASVRLSTPDGRTLPPQAVRGLPYGIGGGIRFHFGEHLRVGTEGYGTYLDYGTEGSTRSRSRYNSSWS